MEEDKMTLLYRLMTDELFGTISPTDSTQLQTLLQESWAWEEWVQFQKTFDKPETVERVQQLIAEDRSADLLKKQIRNRSKSRQLSRAGIAGVVALAIGMGCFYLLRPPSAPPALAHKGIELQLPDGRTIAVSGSSTQLADNTTIYNDTSRHELSYTHATAGDHQLNTLRVPVGMDYHIRLSDGTEVFLNSDSHLSFPFSFDKERREIAISGEAYIKVAKDATRPFVVRLPRSSVEVLGTTFNVNTYDTAKEKVSLQDGLVQVTTPGKAPVRLTPGSQSVFHAGTADMQVRSFSPDELSWIRGVYIFDNAPFEDFKAVFLRLYGIKVVFDDPVAGKERFTGTFLKNEPATSLVQTLEKAMGVHFYYNGDILHIK